MKYSNNLRYYNELLPKIKQNKKVLKGFHCACSGYTINEHLLFKIKLLKKLTLCVVVYIARI